MFDTSIQKLAYLGEFLESLSDNIDLTPTQQKVAVERYNVVGEWLAQEGSPLAKFDPRIIAQGSFRTGLAVRPVNDECEFDVDLTCILNGTLPDIQKALKEMVGKRLNGHCERYELVLEERRRCWRIHYKETSGHSFHLDIVPAIPDTYGWILRQNVPEKYAKHAIAITDIKSEFYLSNSSYWPKSNTEGYSLWFLDAMKYNAHKIERTFSKGIVNMLEAHVEEMPYFDKRTPLQKAIQLFKRHRDIKYGDHDDKPVSIIITTLAAHAYREVMDNIEPQSFYDVLLRIVELMASYITSVGAVSWVANPVNPLENFADKWYEKPIKEKIFREWLISFKDDLQSHNLNEGIHGISNSMSKSFGEKSVRSTIFSMGDQTHIAREEGNLKVSGTGIVGAVVGLPVVKHLFHGQQS
jgi:hypothetical protein